MTASRSHWSRNGGKALIELFDRDSDLEIARVADIAERAVGLVLAR